MPIGSGKLPQTKGENRLRQVIAALERLRDHVEDNPWPTAGTMLPTIRQIIKIGRGGIEK